MTTSPRRTSPSGAALAAALVALSCGTPRTEVLLVIDTDMDVPEELDEVRVDFVGPSGETRRSEGFITGAGDLPRTVGLVDATHSARAVRVTVTGLRRQTNVVQRRAVFTFVPHETRILRMDLLRACVGVACPSDQTCGAEGCRAIEVGPQELALYDPRAVGRLDGGLEPGDGAVDGGCAVAVELCNGADDDCDGDVDEDFDLSRDMQNCGSCGNACPADPDNAASLCESASCMLRCDSGFEDCNGEVDDGCEAVLSKPAHCGECGTSCSGGTPYCQAGDAGFECVATCGAGTVDCAGACVDVTSDPLRCGGCETRCIPPANAVATCMAGSCGFECDAGFADCDGDPANGCESNLRELDNCGRCGVRCERPGAVTSCATGACALVGCLSSRGDCDGDPVNGCEADLGSPATCGACDNACPTGVSQGSVACVGGACRLTCNAGFGNCDAMIANGCEQSLSSPSACGMCGVSCADPTPLCEAVSGGYACTGGCGASTACGASCVDTSSDPSHCGGCDMSCPTYANALASCASGTCGLSCASGFGDCDMDMANGCETPTTTTVSSCGSCGNACPMPANATATCTAGACGYSCQAGFADCNGAASDGCEVSTATDAASCGSCGNACSVPTGATAVGCTSGACAITTCEAGLADCDGTFGNGCEVDTRVNRNHCGACGNACGPAQRCCGSECRHVSDC